MKVNLRVSYEPRVCTGWFLDSNGLELDAASIRSWLREGRGFVRFMDEGDPVPADVSIAYIQCWWPA